MKQLSYLLSTVLFLFFACQKEQQATEKNQDPKITALEARVAQALAEADAVLNEARQTADSRANVTLPAGSNNGLAAAIAAAGPNGKVTVAAGLHYETGTVTISFPVKIIGQPGAVFEWSGLSAPDATPPIQLDPALHVKNANQVTIQGIKIDPGSGGAKNAILLDNSHHAKILSNTLLKFQLAVVTGNADHAKIIGNTVTGVGPAFPGFAWSIVNIDGNHNLITDNDVSDSPVGIFVGDEAGNVWGYLAIDNAFENTIFKNAAANNSLYDIECAAAFKTQNLRGCLIRLGNPLKL